jgi:hypothetical protein
MERAYADSREGARPRWVILLTVVLMLCVSAGRAREEVLSGDDGESDGAGIRLQDGFCLAVGFEAPEWACSLEGLQCYLAAVDPSPTEQGYFFARAWCGGGEPSSPPGQSAYLDVHPVWYDAADAGSWFEVRFSSPPDLTDGVQFPGGRFFVGVEGFTSPRPWFGVDEDAPGELRTFLWNWASWESVTPGDGMVRAIVSDVPTSVQADSWGRLKALFRS